MSLDNGSSQSWHAQPSEAVNSSLVSVETYVELFTLMFSIFLRVACWRKKYIFEAIFHRERWQAERDVCLLISWLTAADKVEETVKRSVPYFENCIHRAGKLRWPLHPRRSSTKTIPGSYRCSLSDFVYECVTLMKLSTFNIQIVCVKSIVIT